MTMLYPISFTIVVRILGAGASLALMLSITHLTGIVEAGIFLFGYSITIILATVSRLGSEVSGLREIAVLCDSGTPEQLSRAMRVRIYLTAALSVLLAGLFALVVAPFAATHFGGDYTSTSIILLALSLPALALIGLLAEFLKSIDHATIAVFYQNAAVPGFTVIGLCAAALVHPMGASGIATAMLIASWMTLGLAALTLLKWWREQPIKLGIAEKSLVIFDFINILREARALLVISSTPIFMHWIGSAMLGIFADPVNVAGFSVAVRLSTLVGMINNAILGVMSPRMSVSHCQELIAMSRNLAHQTSLIIMVITVPALLALYVFAGFWLSFFDPGFTSYANELRILIKGQIIMSAIGHSGSVMVMAGLYRTARFTSIVAIVSLATTMLFAIPFFGTIGASVALSFSAVSSGLVGVILIRQSLNFWTVPTKYGNVVDAIKRLA